jgi:2-hydroxychromene-2-carboxylate isomerase
VWRELQPIWRPTRTRGDGATEDDSDARGPGAVVHRPFDAITEFTAMNAARTIEFLFDFGSPTTYLAHTQLPRIARETGARVDYVPMLLGGVFKATGNQSPVMVPAKGRWMGGDLARFARRYGVPFTFNSNFPINTLTLMRGAVGLQMRQPDRFMAYVDAVFRAMWVEPVNMGDPAVVAKTLDTAGFDAEALMALVGDAEVKAKLIANTESAVARGVFGAPTCFVGDAMFFGQDRLDFVREAVTAGA